MSYLDPDEFDYSDIHDFVYDEDDFEYDEYLFDDDYLEDNDE